MNSTTKSKADDDDGAHFDALSTDIEKLRADLSSLVDSVGTLAKSRLGTEAAEGVARSEEALSDFATELQRIEGDIVTSTRESPWRSLGIAALIGLIVGLILRR